MVEKIDNYIRIPVKRKKKDVEIRTITLSNGMKALYDAKNKVVVTYLFDVNKYTMKQAKSWVKNHKNSVSYSTIVDNLSLIQDIRDNFEATKDKVISEVAKLVNDK